MDLKIGDQVKVKELMYNTERLFEPTALESYIESLVINGYTDLVDKKGTVVDMFDASIFPVVVIINNIEWYNIEWHFKPEELEKI